MAANPHRATTVVALGKPPIEHDVCLNLGALAEIEADLKCSVLELLPTEERDGRLGFREAIVVLQAGLKGAGKPVSRAVLMEMLEPMRRGDILVAAFEALGAAFREEAAPANPPEAASPSAASPGTG